MPFYEQIMVSRAISSYKVAIHSITFNMSILSWQMGEQGNTRTSLVSNEVGMERSHNGYTQKLVPMLREEWNGIFDSPYYLFLLFHTCSFSNRRISSGYWNLMTCKIRLKKPKRRQKNFFLPQWKISISPEQRLMMSELSLESSALNWQYLQLGHWFHFWSQQLALAMYHQTHDHNKTWQFRTFCSCQFPLHCQRLM